MLLQYVLQMDGQEKECIKRSSRIITIIYDQIGQNESSSRMKLKVIEFMDVVLWNTKII